MPDLNAREVKVSKIVLTQMIAEGERPARFRYRVKKLVNRLKPYLQTTLEAEQVAEFMQDPMVNVEIV
jgi:hypothetical protein